MNISRLLYVEDDPDDLVIICAAIAEIDSSVQCVTAVDGQDALEILEVSPAFDLILLDINMPRLDGFHTLEILRQNNSFKHIPVVILTTARDREAVAKIQALGVMKVLSKPESFHETKALLRKLLNELQPLSE